MTRDERDDLTQITGMINTFLSLSLLRCVMNIIIQLQVACEYFLIIIIVLMKIRTVYL